MLLTIRIGSSWGRILCPVNVKLREGLLTALVDSVLHDAGGGDASCRISGDGRDNIAA